MHVGVPSLLASVVMLCHMCNRPSATVLCVCVYASIACQEWQGSFTECILQMHKGVRGHVNVLCVSCVGI